MDRQSFFAITFLLCLTVHFAYTWANAQELGDTLNSDFGSNEKSFLRKIHGEEIDNGKQVEWRRETEPAAASPQNSNNKNRMRSRILKYDFLRNQWVLGKPSG